jgi:hypothetical protein
MEPNRQANLAQELFDETEESEEEYEEVYPVQTRDKGKKKTPYTRPKKTTPEVVVPTKKTQEEVDEWNKNMDEMIKQSNQQEDEEMREKKKPKTKKEYTHLRERFLSSNAGLSQKEVIELSTVYKKQLTEAIKGVGPKIVTVEATVNSIQNEPRQKKRTSAYITAAINGRRVDVIVDTGAGFNLVTKGLADELGMDLDRPVSTPISCGRTQKRTSGRIRRHPSHHRASYNSLQCRCNCSNNLPSHPWK